MVKSFGYYIFFLLGWSLLLLVAFALAMPREVMECLMGLLMRAHRFVDFVEDLMEIQDEAEFGERLREYSSKLWRFYRAFLFLAEIITFPFFGLVWLVWRLKHLYLKLGESLTS